MSVTEQILFPEVVSLFGDITDINMSLTGNLDGVINFGPATLVVGGYIFELGVTGDDDCFFSTLNTEDTLPITSDPPFPPVWPYFWSTGEIYGRDHLSVNLKMVRSDTYAFEIAVILNGAAVDLTGGVLTMTAKWDVVDLDANAVFVRSTGNGGIVVTDATGGLATVTIASANTTALPAHTVNLVYDIQLVNTLGNIYTVLNGILTVVPDVTTV